MKSRKQIDKIFEEGMVIDGYKIEIIPHPERLGKFCHLIDGQRYGNKAFKDQESALEDAKKTVEIRKQADAKTLSRNQNVDLNVRMVDDFFKHAKKSGNPNS